MTALWWLNPVAQFERLAVMRETPGRVYFLSPLDGSERFVCRRHLERLGWLSTRVGFIYTAAARAAFLTVAGRPPPDGALAELGLPAGASIDDVRRAYRERAKAVHPDAGGSDEAFVALQKSYERALAAVGS